MLKGKELGLAITKAIDLKIASGSIATKTEVARHFGVELPSLYGWMKRGTISKDKLPKLWNYFSDVVGPEHWGLKETTFTVNDTDTEGAISLKGYTLAQENFIKRMAEIAKELSPDELPVAEEGIVATSSALKAKRRKKSNKGK